MTRSILITIHAIICVYEQVRYEISKFMVRDSTREKNFSKVSELIRT